MFQYAAGIAAARRLKTTLTLDTSETSRLPSHYGFELDKVFNITARQITSRERRRLLGWRQFFVSTGSAFYSHLAFLRPATFIAEPQYGFWNQFNSVKDNSYCYGYWQAPRYFEGCEDLLRKEFTFKETLQGDDARIATEILNTDSVSVHVRRGDYVTNAKTARIHGTCSLAYYETAIEYALQAVKSPRLFIFSDDKPWANENIAKRFGGRVVEPNTAESGAVDLRLMSLAKHFIIANSTFSWWAAWLGNKPGNLVICPAKWFKAQHLSARDLIPATWVRLG